MSFTVLAWFTFTENSGHSEHSGAEAAADGSGHLDALQRLPAHRAVLRGLVPRGRCVDLHGGHGHQSRQILHQSLPPQSLDPGEHTRQHHFSGMFVKL